MKTDSLDISGRFLKSTCRAYDIQNDAKHHSLTSGWHSHTDAGNDETLVSVRHKSLLTSVKETDEVQISCPDISRSVW